MLTTGADSTTTTQMIESIWCPELSHWNDRDGLTCVQSDYDIDDDF